MQGISIIIPVFNEEEILRENSERLMKYVDSLNVKYEIIIASNGSSDDTAKIGKELMKNNKIKFFHIPRRGVGDAFKKAVKMSEYDFIVSVDMDLSVDLNFIKKSLTLIKNYDIIIGSKQMGSQKRSFLRKIPSYVFIFLTRLLLGISYKDHSMAAKVYNKKFVLNNLNAIHKGASYVTNLLYIAHKKRLKIIEIPVVCVDSRNSKFNIAHESWYRFWQLIKLAFINPEK